MWKWSFSFALSLSLLIILIESLSYPTTLAQTIEAVPEGDVIAIGGVIPPAMDALLPTAHVEALIPRLDSIQASAAISASEVYTGLGGSFVISRTQISDDNKITVYKLSISDTVTVSLHADADGLPAEGVITSTLVTSGTYSNIELTIPPENQPQADAKFWVQLFEPAMLTATESVSVELRLESVLVPSPVVTFTVAPTQTGDGSKIIVDELSLSGTVTVSLHADADADGLPAETAITSTMYTTGTYSNIELTIPPENRPQVDTRYWLQLFEPAMLTATESVSVELHLESVLIPSPVVTFTVVPTQTGDGSKIIVDELSLSGTVTVSLHADADGLPAETAITSTMYTTGTYSPIELTIPPENQPQTDAKFWVQLFEPAMFTATESVSVELRLEGFASHSVINSLIVTPTQMGDGSEILIHSLSVSDTVTVSLHTDENNLPSAQPVSFKNLEAGDHENIPLPVPQENQPFEDSRFWIQIFEPGRMIPTQSIVVELQAQDRPPLSTVITFTATSPQLGNGTFIRIDELTNNEPVSLTLSLDDNGQPAQQSITSTVQLTGTHLNLPLVIPEAFKPAENSLFWVQVFESGSISATRALSIALELDFQIKQSKNGFMIVTTPQIGDGSEIIIDQLVSTSVITATLYEAGSASTEPLAYTVLVTDTYDNFDLEIPPDKQPVQDTTYWVRLYDTNPLTATDEISVSLQITYDKDKPGRFNISPVQISNGAEITIEKPIVYVDKVYVGVYESDLSGESVGELITFQALDGPDNYQYDVPIILPKDKRPIQDSVLWVGLHRAADERALFTKPMPLRLLLRTTISDFVVSSVQEGNGSALVIDKFFANKSVTVTVESVEQGVVSVTELDGNRIHQNVMLPIPEALRPKTDTEYTVSIYANESCRLSRSASEERDDVPRLSQTPGIPASIPEQTQLAQSRNNSQPKCLSGASFKPIQTAAATLDLPPIVDMSLSTRQLWNGASLKLDFIQISEEIKISVFDDDQQSEDSALADVNLSQPGVYGPMYFNIDADLQNGDEATYWYHFVDRNGMKVREPISITLRATAIPTDWDLSSGQISNGTQITIASVNTDIPLIVALHQDENGYPKAGALDTLELPSGDYPNSLIDTMALFIPEEMRPITNTLYWVQAFDRDNLNNVVISQTVMLTLSDVLQTFELDPSQSGFGQEITIRQLDVTDQVTVTLYAEMNGSSGVVVGQEVIEAGSHSNLKIEIYEELRPRKDTTYTVQIDNRRNTQPIRVAQVNLDLPPLLELNVNPNQVGSGEYIKVDRLRVSGPITLSLYLRDDPLAERLYTGLYDVDFPEGDLLLSIPDGRRTISGTAFYRLELTLVDNQPVTNTISISLTIDPDVADAGPIDATTVITPYIQVHDQDSYGYNVLVDRVQTPANAWLVIYKQQNSSYQIIGQKWVGAGNWKNIYVFFSDRVEKGAVLLAALHKDTGAQQDFNYPTDDRLYETSDGSQISKSLVLGLPTISVEDKQVVRSAVTISELIAPHSGWLALYQVGNQQLLGYQKVPAGRSKGVIIHFTENLPKAGETKLLAVLHKDVGVENRAELPLPDIVSEFGEGVVSASFVAVIDPFACGLSGTGYFFNGDEPFLTVKEPIQLIDHTLQVDDLCLPENGWVAVYRDVGGSIGDLIGQSRIIAGNAPESISIEILPPRPFNQPIWIVLHADSGQIGRFEVPEPDLPIWVNGKPAVIRTFVGPPTDQK